MRHRYLLQQPEDGRSDDSTVRELEICAINDGAFGPIFVYTARSDAVTSVDGEQFGLRDADGLEKTELTAAIRQAGAIQLDGVTL